jgi:phage shock protein PspC (stress-responsive transcriptional regulator)
MQNRLVRPINGRILAGVCAGLADWIGMDATLIRLIFLVLGFMTGSGLLIYIILWVIIPSANEAPNMQGDWSYRAGQMRDDFIRRPVNPYGCHEIGWRRSGCPGCFLLAREIRPEWFYWANKGVMWALVLIGVGAIFVVRALRGDK